MDVRNESAEPRDETICRKHLRTEDLQILEIRVEVLSPFLSQWYLRLPVNYRPMNSGRSYSKVDAGLDEERRLESGLFDILGPFLREVINDR